jgi:Leucine-rich repeat (LRR) protein
MNQTVSYPPTVTDLAQLPEGAVHFTDSDAVALLAPHAGLTALPDAIRELTTLRRIDLDHNALTHLPAEITALRELQSLLLYGNRLTAIPPELGHLRGAGRGGWIMLVGGDDQSQ